MPNSRRRRFSVHNVICSKENRKIQSGLQTNSMESEGPFKMSVNHSNLNKLPSSSSRNSNEQTNAMKIIVDRESQSSICTVKRSIGMVGKDITTSSSNINLSNTSFVEPLKRSVEKYDPPKRARQMTRDSNQTIRDKNPRQHRVKVRSPKRRIPDIQIKSDKEIVKRNIGTHAIAWEQEEESFIDAIPNVVVVGDERQSENSLDDMCRICHGGDSLSSELGQLISACSCRGTVGRVHVKCLERWLTESGKSRCELCGTRYTTQRVHRYGVPKALVMWILSQNAKQLLVDSLGIMLMSPLAVLAAWLSGRTLAGLMTQDNRSAPWPLASTFVLACMTLVCYYCWIVSAATRHALGWWVWYRSQYEVRLTLQTNED